VKVKPTVPCELFLKLIEAKLNRNGVELLLLKQVYGGSAETVSESK